MKNLSLPVKYRKHGLHIWCITCKKTVTSVPCRHAEAQRFQSRIYNPVTKKQDCINSYNSRDPHEAFSLHQKYREQLKESNFNIPSTSSVPTQSEQRSTFFLKAAAQKYLDYIQDIGIPEYEKKSLSKVYILDQTRYVERFLKTVQKIEKKISNFPVTLISQIHVAAFDEYVRGLDQSERSYQAHINGAKYFIKFLIENLEIEMKNPFDKVKLREIHYTPEIIPVEEFELLLSVITPENGTGVKGNRKETVNYYRPWLKKILIFSLLTGERLDGIVLLQWKHIEGNFLRIPNWKVNRIQKAEHYFSYTPITADLAELLIEFNMTGPEDFIIVPEIKNRENLKKFISRAFTHYWKVTGLKRKVSFKHLRKTYVTRMASLIGEKALFIKHGEDKTAIKHYLNKKEILDQTKNVKLYEISDWLHNTEHNTKT
jgi:integrase